MKYISTRGHGEPVFSANAIVKGLAPDGGLYTPYKIIQLSEYEINAITTASYIEVAKIVFSKFLSDFSVHQINTCVNKAYQDTFKSPEVTPIHDLTDKTKVLELWHGPTSAFKDVALQALPHLLTTSVQIIGEKDDIAIIVATSGDTGKAALEGFKNVDGTQIVVMYPNKGVSSIQKQQMVTQEGNNVNVIAIQGNFDDAQSAAKKIFTDSTIEQEFLDKNIKLSSANSINWGRLLPQIVYYVRSSFTIHQNEKLADGELIDYIVPTGNFKLKEVTTISEHGAQK